MRVGLHKSQSSISLKYFVCSFDAIQCQDCFSANAIPSPCLQKMAKNELCRGKGSINAQAARNIELLVGFEKRYMKNG